MLRSVERRTEDSGEIIRKLYRRSVTSIIIAAVAASFGMLIDGVVIGKFLGTESMAAYGIVTPLFSIMTAVSGVLATGSQVFCAKHLGEGRVDRARQVFSACMILTVVISVLITAVLFVFCRPICVGLGAKGPAAGLLPLTMGYLYGISPGILPVILLFIFNALMRLDSDPERIIAAVAAMTVCDIAGDLLNALVIHGGMVGMGVSTAVSYWVALVIMLMHFRKKDIIFRASVRDIRREDMLGIFRVGAPNAIGSGSVMVRNLILNLLMVGIAGSTAVAALSVRNTLNTLFGAILLGASMTTAMIAGMVYGEEDRNSVKDLLSVSLRYTFLMGILLAVLVFAAAPYLVALFTGGKGDPVRMAELAVRAMRVYAFGLPLYGLNMVFVSYLQGIGRLKLANTVSLIDNVIYAVIIALILSPALKTGAVWLSYPIGEALVILTVVLCARRERKQMPCGTEDMLFLPDDFGVSPEDTYEKSLRTMEDIMTASYETAAFMKEKHAAEKEVLLVPLFVEEMAGNVIEHGFTKDGKAHSVDLRVLQKDGDWTVRIRDDCVSFDPLQRASVFDPGDPAANIGIRMVIGMAKDIKYMNVMQLNDLIIRL